MIIIDGQIIASADQAIEITREQYEALSDKEKNDPLKTYYITDDEPDSRQQFIALKSLIGNEKNMTGISDGTIIGAIKELYERLGGLKFTVNPETMDFSATYDPRTTEPAVITKADTTLMTDKEKIEYFNTLIGDLSELEKLGHDSIISALKDLYNRMSELAFRYVPESNTVQILPINEQ